MKIVDEDVFLNDDYVPDLPSRAVSPGERLSVFRQKSTGNLAVHFMVVAVVDSFKDGPPTRVMAKRIFLDYFGEGLQAAGHSPENVFEAAFESCIREEHKLLFGTEETGFTGGFRVKPRPV
ncbi:hypothetical protein H7J86_25425 [Mycobacterium hackensackense]|uniref:hypothetical protein n=1 Tax=Mycobacterium hackensackense TaxID=228909 RepID=UPI0022657F0C|nr:hypothetical protein [Mycobacterium hackensackense]MCV7255507.1 hypothetical protein [Mycobacterium hackensackense]